MKNIKTFETWKNNIIDDNLFTSGKAKYNPKVYAGEIKYKSGNSTPYYFAKIEKSGSFFICKIFKKTSEGENIRLRNKKKNDLKSAHNYIREFINQRLKKDEKRDRKKNDDSISIPRNQNIEKNNIFRDEYNDKANGEPNYIPSVEPPKYKTIIRRY